MNKKKVSVLSILVVVALLSQVAFINSVVQKTISINLEYKGNSQWDSDNDGVESNKAAIDFSVENTEFSWDANYEKVCTKWEVYSSDIEDTTQLCYGSNTCCNFIDLDSEKPNWNDVLYLQHGQNGASENNRVSARVIYFDYNLEGANPYSDIYYSEFDYLYAVYLDSNYFSNELAEDITSDIEYINILSSFEKVKANSNVAAVTLTDINGNNVAGDLSNEDLKMEFHVDENITVTVNNFKESDLNKENIDKVTLEKENAIIEQQIRYVNLIPKKSISLKGIENILSEESYDGIIEFSTENIVYNGVMYCDDFYQCTLLERCDQVEQDCYLEENKKVKVFIPHFSSIVLVLNTSTIDITITSPDNSGAYSIGENIYLNFTTNITLTASYTLDSGDYNPLGASDTFSSKVNGSLQYGVIGNGGHELRIFLMDNVSDIVNYTYSFSVSDVTAPNIALNISNNSVISTEDNPYAITITSDEFSNIVYELNGGGQQSAPLGDDKSESISITLSEGVNNLIINASDMQGNYKIDVYTFNFTTLPSCSDGIQNGDETGIDCGGSCGGCIEFQASLGKSGFNLSENIAVTIVSRPYSNVSLDVLFASSSVFYEYIENPSPQYPLNYIKPIDNINQAGNYTINTTMYYMGNTESKMLYFHVESSDQNPLSVTLNSNATTINRGQTIAFSSSVSGNTSAVTTYNWKFGDGGTATGWNATHTYLTNSTYIANLSVEWDGWIKSAVQTITVRELFNITVLVKNESDQIVQGAEVEFVSIEKNTTAEGKASFLINSGSHSLRVSKEGYSSFSNNTEVHINKTVHVVLKEGGSDDVKPIIKLLGPENDATITKSNTTVRYSVLDSSDVRCTLYINMEGGWWVEKKYESGITNNDERNFRLDDLEDKHYQWKIECVDEFDNSQTSETRNFYVNKSIVTEDDISLDAKIGEVDGILSSLGYLDKNEKEASIAMKLEKQLGDSRKGLQRAKRDLHNLVWRKLNESELDVVRQEIFDRIKEIDKTTPRTIKVIESKEFVGYPNKEDIRNVSFTLLELDKKKYKKKEKEAYANYNQGLQDLIRITTMMKIIDVEYMSGEQGTITLIEKVVKAEDNLTGTSIVEVIPKAIAANTSLINALFDYSVILEDPMIKLEPMERYAYYINKKTELDGVKEIKSVLVAEDTAKQNPIIGFTIFGGLPSRLLESTNIRLIIEVIIIIILAMVYIGFSGGFKKVKYLVKDRDALKNVKEIDASVETAFTDLQNNQYDKAKSAYKDINEKFKVLPKDIKKDIYSKIVLLSGRLDVFHINKLVDKALFNLEHNQREPASQIYKQVSGIYKSISPKFKSKVLERSKELYGKLNEPPKSVS
ncbi:MAG: PKD domain-containing protein [Nanoarchaeota archaeon]|nr:PKD domain-containing protein [Nanoarchaeota archaeon]